jgi:hypothetical protein
VCCLWRTGQCPVPQALAQANQPLSGIHPTRSAIIHRTVRCAPDCPVSQRSNGSLRANGRLQKCTVANSAAQKSEHISQRSPDCPVWHQTVRCSKKIKGSNGQQLQTLRDALTGRAPDSEQCLSGAPPDCPVRSSPAETTNN